MKYLCVFGEAEFNTNMGTVARYSSFALHVRISREMENAFIHFDRLDSIDMTSSPQQTNTKYGNQKNIKLPCVMKN